MSDMRMIRREQVEAALSRALPELAFEVPKDVLAGLERAYESETGPRAREALALLVENARVASQDRVAICQDTGSVWVCLEAGPDTCVAGDVFAGVNDVVARVYAERNLRKSLVRDALLDRANSGDNTPAFCEIETCSRPGARLHVMCKGGGSDNASRVVMLTPSAGRDGIRETPFSHACARRPRTHARRSSSAWASARRSTRSGTWRNARSCGPSARRRAMGASMSSSASCSTQ